MAIDIEGPAPGQAAGRQGPKGLAHLLVSVRQDWEAGAILFSKGFIVLKAVNTRHKVGDIKLAYFLVTVTQRLAFESSATGKGLWKERDDDELLVPEVGKRVVVTIAAR